MMRLGLKRTFFLTIVALATLLFAAGTVTAAEEKSPKVDNFTIFLDHSGSMGMTHPDMKEKKIDVAINSIQTLLGLVPELDYKASFHTFAPYREYQPLTTYDWVGMGEAVTQVGTEFDIFNRLTPMGNGLQELDPVVSGASGSYAVVMVSDGESNIGQDPVAQAKSMYAKHGGNLCFHILSVASTASGQKILDEIAALDSCTVSANAADLLDDNKAMEQFAKDIFYTSRMIAERDKPAEPMREEKADTTPTYKEPEPTPSTPSSVPEAGPCDESIVFRSVHFDFDKAAIKESMIPVLQEAAEIMKERPCYFVIEGHTDSIGTEKYNQGLSERRANAVKDYLIGLGVSSYKIETVGYGELSPKYDNDTREGRRLNRRAEIKFK